ncbi:gluconate 2-dehydrogenase subunit 3 family protein [Oscillatoria amoena NRMC-F 0135]|nr:gluconate 2-dehydrogenase subunit 3 family protein [Oscillatoria amoena NRMC-F 0135]
MSDLVQLQTLDRRQVIRSLALALTATGVLDLDAAQHVHEETAAARKGGPYKPKEMTAGEMKTLGRLAELIVPADEVSGSAKDAGAPEFIDTLASQNEKLADIYHGGLAWLDAEMRKRYGKTFVDASEMQQKAMLDLLVEAERQDAARRSESLVFEKSDQYRDFANYGVKPPIELAAGARFFDWVRKMTVDAFYTSPLGFKDLGFLGNKALSKYEVPAPAMEYALKRSPFA